MLGEWERRRVWGRETQTIVADNTCTYVIRVCWQYITVDAIVTLRWGTSGQAISMTGERKRFRHEMHHRPSWLRHNQHLRWITQLHSLDGTWRCSMTSSHRKSRLDSFQVNVTLKKPGSKLEHQGIKVELIGQIELYYDRGNHHEFVSLVRELARPGDLIQNSSYPFEFANVEKPFEVYVGSNVRLR